MTPPTVSSDAALVGWAAGPAVAAELEAEKTMMRGSERRQRDGDRAASLVGAASGRIGRRPCDRALRAAAPAARRLRDAHPRISGEFTGPLEQSLTMLSPRQVELRLARRHARARTRAGRSWRGRRFSKSRATATRPDRSCTSIPRAKDDLAEIDAQHVSLQGRDRARPARRSGRRRSAHDRSDAGSRITSCASAASPASWSSWIRRPPVTAAARCGRTGNYKNTQHGRTHGRHVAARLHDVPAGRSDDAPVKRRWSARRTRVGTRFRTRRFPS